MLRKILTPALVLILFVSFTYSQSLNIRFNTHVYSWERADSMDVNDEAVKTRHFRGYQNLLLDVNYGKFTLNTLAQTEEDLSGNADDSFNYRLYNLYLKGTNLFNVLDLKLGRQYLYAGAGKGTIDGLSFKIKAGKNKQFQLTAYGGILTPLDYTFENYGKLNENYLTGAMVSYYGFKGTVISLSYAKKNKKPLPFNYVRFDTLFNPVNVTFDLDSKTEQVAGIDLNYDHQNLGRYFGYVKAYFDVFKDFEPQHIEALFRGRATERLNAFAGYMYHQPKISYNSLFSVFTSKELHEIEAGIDYNVISDFDASIKAAYVMYNNETTAESSVNLVEPSDNTIKMTIGFTNPQYGIQYTRFFGYSGESNAIYGYYARQLIEKLSTHASLSFSNYRLGDFEETNGVTNEMENALAGSLGFTYRPMRHLAFDLQGQYLFNRIYKSDLRLLFGVNLWLFKNFNR